MAFTTFGPASSQSTIETISVGPPAGYGAGDLWVVWVCTDASSSMTLDTPSGWTAFGAQAGDTAADRWGQGYFRICTASESATTFGDVGGSSALDVAAISFGLRGFDPADVLEAYGTPVVSTVSTTAITGPSVTPANNGCLIMGFWCYADSAGTRTFSPPASFTTVQIHQDTNITGDAAVAIWEQATAAAIAPAATVSAATASWIAFTVAINPALGGGGAVTRSQIVNAVG